MENLKEQEREKTKALKMKLKMRRILFINHLVKFKVIKYLFLVIILLCSIGCFRKLKFENTAQKKLYRYCYTNDGNSIPCYSVTYLVSNYNSSKDSLLLDFVYKEFRKVNQLSDSILKVSFSFYKKNNCTEKYLRLDPYGKACIADPETKWGCTEYEINSYSFKRINKESTRWIFMDFGNETSDTIEVKFCNKLQ